ncbi:DUF6851 domain-containing protein [Roseobacter sp.]|uniref:DUF6851 domain-containing protein n=1 Tax=Roseobacter sp. TaxID=1907202 RepID=UPI002965EE5D|nr:Ig-like domain-containing protein [Roseobacter sp.]MDW3181514.1 Ig-like domain-containing protein [Roseobacter sp.]
MAFDSSRSVVAQWNELALEAIRLGDPVPTEITRALHIAHSAIYDAWAAYDAEAAGYYFQGVATGEDTQDARAEAVNYAAFHALSEVFPDQVYLFKDFLTSLGFDPDLETTDLSTPGGVGIAAAQTVISARANDGANSANDFEDTSGYEPGNSNDPDDPDFDPNLWTPLRVPTGAVRDENGIPIATDNPASYKVQEPISPHWGSVDPFAIEDSDDYLPPAPPKLGDFSEYVDATGKVTTGDAAYREQFGALVDISANLTTEQKVIAEYWADGPQTSTPPGHWNEIAQDVSVREGYGLDEDVKLFFALNNALFDAGIAIWDAKYTYDYVRPQTAIRHLYDGETISSWAGPNQGTQDIAGGEWIPYQNVTFVTPAFPEYTSGHSGFSYAAATIIEAFTGTDVYYDGTSRGAYDLDGDGERDLLGQYVTDELAFEDGSGDTVTLQWASLWDAAAEAGLSRLYGGIHIQDGDLFGRQIGAEVAEDVWGTTRLLFDRDGDNVFDASEASTLHLGAGSDQIIGALAELDGLQVFDFGRDDVIRVSGLALPDGGFAVSPGSAVLELDQDGDGTPDAIVTLEGDYGDDRFIAVEVDGQTTLRIATDADVELTDTAERFITTDASANVVAAGDGDDVLVSAGGGDILDGDGGNDVLLGGDEDDILIGGGGGDVTTGGAGADIFSFDASDAPAASGFTAEFITDFESGVDKVELSGYAGLSFDTFSWTSAEAGVALVLPNNRFIVFEGIDDESELSEQDFVFPTSGRDVVFAESKPQILTEADDRYVSSGSVADDVDGRGGDDAIITGDGADFLGGGIGDDVLNAGAGEDTLEGGSGADNLTGGADADLFRFFGDDDPAGSGFVADFVTDYEAGIDRFEIFGFAGIGQFSDISFLALEAGLGANLGGGRFIVFEGVFDQADLNEGDFTFTGDAPDLALALRTDTGTSASDQVTADEAIIGGAFDDVGIARVEVRIEGQDDYKDATSFLQEDGNFVLDALALEELFGTPVADGLTTYEVRVTDIEGNQTEDTISYTLDRAAASVADAPSGIFDVSPDTLTVAFTEAMANGAFDATAYALRDGAGQSIEITSIDRINDTTARLNLADTLRNDDYTLEIPAAADIAGNAPAEPTNATFTVDALTRIVNVGPTEGTKRANLDRQIVVEFDQPVDRSTVDAESFQVIALGEPLEGRITVSSNGQVITFFPDDLLPAATELRIKVDGDKIIGEDGSPIDADGDGSPGGTLESDFQTITLTRVPDTNIEGFIFDANYRDDDGLDIPLEGVVVSVVGLPNVSAVTDENGRFFLEDLPIPQVYLEFDASNVTNRPDFDYGTIDKPVDTIAGQTVGLSSGDKAFNIYFAALAEGDVTEIVEGEETEAGIGENGLANLTEIFPNIDPSQWEKLKVTIPADSLSFDDGTLAEEVSVMVFEPDRIPAPLPPGFDPTVVFTVKAGDATNVDGKAQIDFPNLDGLALGEKRPILSFDHDAGEWVQSGTAIVVDDGNGGTVLRSEGDTGVNTLGWKGVGQATVSPAEIETVQTAAGPEVYGEVSGTFGQQATAYNSEASMILAGSDGSGGVYAAEAENDENEDQSFMQQVMDYVDSWRTATDSEASNDDRRKATMDIISKTPIPGQIGGSTGHQGVAEAAKKLMEREQTLDDLIDQANQINGGPPPQSPVPEDRLEVDLGIFQFSQQSANEGLARLTDIFLDYSADVQTFTLSAEQAAADRDLLENALSSFIDLTQEAVQLAEELGDFSSIDDLGDLKPFLDEIEALNGSSSLGLATAFDFANSITESILRFEEELRSQSTMSDKTAEFWFYVVLNNGTEIRLEGTIESFAALIPLGQSGIVQGLSKDLEVVVHGQFDSGLLGSGGLQLTEYPSTFLRLDGDEDGLLDLHEEIIGTSISRQDTDRDGILDGAEIEQSLSPLDGVGFPTGVIGGLSLKGEANDLTVIGDLNGEGQTAFIATGSHGLATVDASQFSNPILIGELNLPGTAEQVSVDATRNLAFVAAGDAGLHIVDVSDPNMPELLHTTVLTGETKTVLSLDGVVVAGADGASVLSATGELLAVSFPPNPVLDIKQKDGKVFVLTDFELLSYEFTGLALELIDTVELPFPTSRRTSNQTTIDDPQLFIQGDTAFISNGYESAILFANNTADRGGYVTVDLSDPTDLQLISDVSTPEVQSGFADMALNGSGLAVVASGFLGVQVHNASDPANTYGLLTQIDTDGSARAIEIASGIAYVADGSGGLKVINYLPFDNKGQAPTISINTDASDIDPDVAGLQIVEGETVRISTSIIDDEQVRNVELLVNGEVVLNDVSPPFDLSFFAPRIADVGDEVTVEVRATDTGGNRQTSDPILFFLVPDTVRPEVFSISLEDGDFTLSGNTRVQVQFTESMDIASLDLSNVRLIVPAEEYNATAIDVVFIADDSIVQFVFEDVPTGDGQLSFDLKGATDRSGNLLLASPETINLTLVEQPIVSIENAAVEESASSFDSNALEFIVELSNPFTEEVTVFYRLLSGTGTAGAEGDAYPGPGPRSPVSEASVTFAPGETSKTIPIWTAGNASGSEPAELDEAVVLQAFSVQGAAFAGGGSTLEATGWILDIDGSENPLAGFVSRPNIVEGDAGEKNAIFEISFSRPIPEAITLSYETVDGGAEAGSDYTAVSGTIDLVAGQTVAAVSVPVLGDTDVEFSESFTLAVSTTSTAVAEIAQGQATILDDDAGGAQPTVSIAPAASNESFDTFDSNALIFAATLSEAATEEVTVFYRLLSGTGTAGAEGDAYPGPGPRSPVSEASVTFAPGETSKTIPIWTAGTPVGANLQSLTRRLCCRRSRFRGRRLRGVALRWKRQAGSWISTARRTRLRDLCRDRTLWKEMLARRTRSSRSASHVRSRRRSP